MTKEMTDAEWLRGYVERQRVHSYIMSKYEYDYLLSIAAKLEQQEKPVRDTLNMEKAQSISDAMMDLVDRLGSEASDVDPRCWDHLLVYAPKPPVREVPDIVRKLHDYIYHWESRSQSAYSLALILMDHFEKDAK